MHDCYSLVFLLRNFGLVWPTRLIFLTIGGVLCVGSILRCPHPVTEGVEMHACIVAIKDKKMGSIPT